MSQALSAFSPKATKEEKLRTAFSCYDVDGDGEISHSDMFLILKMLVRALHLHARRGTISMLTIAPCVRVWT